MDHGGFAPAARALGVPKSKLSRRIALLEDRLGTRLISVLPAWRPRGGIFHAVFPSRRGLLASVRALLDFLGESLDEVDFYMPGAQ